MNNKWNITFLNVWRGLVDIPDPGMYTHYRHVIFAERELDELNMDIEVHIYGFGNTAEEAKQDAEHKIAEFEKYIGDKL